MGYCVRTLDGNRWHATEEGISHFKDISDGMLAGESFYVQSDESPFDKVGGGLSTGSGFVTMGAEYFEKVPEKVCVREAEKSVSRGASA